jgi:hypothetical protein
MARVFQTPDDPRKGTSLQTPQGRRLTRRLQGLPLQHRRPIGPPPPLLKRRTGDGERRHRHLANNAAIWAVTPTSAHAGYPTIAVEEACGRAAVNKLSTILLAYVGNGENARGGFDNPGLQTALSSCQRPIGLMRIRQQCRPFSLTCLAICLAKPRACVRSFSATGEQPTRLPPGSSSSLAQ